MSRCLPSVLHKSQPRGLPHCIVPHHCPSCLCSHLAAPLLVFELQTNHVQGVLRTVCTHIRLVCGLYSTRFYPLKVGTLSCNAIRLDEAAGVTAVQLYPSRSLLYSWRQKEGKIAATASQKFLAEYYCHLHYLSWFRSRHIHFPIKVHLQLSKTDGDAGSETTETQRPANDL